MRRIGFFLLAAILLALIFFLVLKQNDLNKSMPEIEVLSLTDVVHLPDFPSGSSIEYLNGKFYIAGDDAREILILDNRYRRIGSQRLFESEGRRIPKEDKLDIEASALITWQGSEQLFLLGSGSGSRRKKGLLVSVDTTYLEFNTVELTNQISEKGIDVNIEGLTVIGNELVLANRGSESQPFNHLILTGQIATDTTWSKDIRIARLGLPESGQSVFLGVSEVHFIKQSDLLLVTMTTEATSNSYDDGEIGDSYLGLIHNASVKLKNEYVEIDTVRNLTHVDSRFAGHKVEGICVEYVNPKESILYMVSDNDNGETTLFRVQMSTR